MLVYFNLWTEFELILNVCPLFLLFLKIDMNLKEEMAESV